jgi:acylphosphatase
MLNEKLHKGLHCFVSGRVQGVFFRQSTQAQANLCGLTGWARNLQDGRVEVVAIGNQQQLERFKQWLNTGPPMAQVIDVECEEVEFQKFEGFSIR